MDVSIWALFIGDRMPSWWSISPLDGDNIVGNPFLFFILYPLFVFKSARSVKYGRRPNMTPKNVGRTSVGWSKYILSGFIATYAWSRSIHGTKIHLWPSCTLYTSICLNNPNSTENWNDKAVLKAFHVDHIILLCFLVVPNCMLCHEFSRCRVKI